MNVLETARLYLRNWVPDDWVRLKPLVTDPRVTRYIGDTTPWPDSRIAERVAHYIEMARTRGWILWPVIHRDDARLIGFCGFSDGFAPEIEIGWRLLPEYWGQGLATEIARATLDYGLRTWQLPRVISVAQSANAASIRVMEKIGLQLERDFEQNGISLVQYATGQDAAAPVTSSTTTTPFDIFRATPADVELVAGLFDSYRKSYAQSSDVAAAREFLSERLSRNESVIFVARREGSGLGFTQLYPSFSSVSLRSIWILNDLFVTQDARRTGIASKLLQVAQAFARDQGARRLVLATAHDNVSAQTLYETKGWVREQDFWHYQFELD